MYRLIRERDGLIKESEKILFVEFNENGTFKEKHSTIKVGRHLLMSPFNMYYEWLTTEIVEILEETDDHCKFKTENSIYTLFNE
jgi:hypothetical protein